MSGWLGLIGTVLPLFPFVLGAGGWLAARRLWSVSLAATLLSLLCFFLLVLRFYARDFASDAVVYSPLVLPENPWSSGAVFRWDFQAALLSLACAAVLACFHFLARASLERSRASIAALAGFLASLTGLLGAESLLLFTVFYAGALVPRLVFLGLDTHARKIEVIKETIFLQVIGIFSLLICLLIFSPPFHSTLPEWFVIEGSTYAVLPGSIGFCLLLLAAAIGSGLFPFHGSARKLFELASIERAVPLCLQSLLGFVLLFRFGPALFPKELLAFSAYFVALFSLGAFYAAANFLGARRARERVFWLYQFVSAFIALGFFSLSPKGWHGAEALLFFQALVTPFFLIVLACHESRESPFPVRSLREFPLFALATVAAVLFHLMLPASLGFYGLLLVVWSLVGVYHFPLVLVLLAIPLIAFGSMAILFFHLEEGSGRNEGGQFFELRPNEIVALLPLGGLLLLLGLVPNLVLGPIAVAVSATFQALGWK